MDAGLFGGTFNPLHNGHIGIIRHVKDACGLDKIFLYPSASPPHKPTSNLAKAHDRMAMVASVVADMPGFEASDIELKRQGPSFTIDTLDAFEKVHGPCVNFHLLMGSDAFFDIPTWKDQEKIFQRVPIIVMLRGERTGLAPYASFIDERISKGYKLKMDNTFVHGNLKPIRICNVPKIDISSTQIRNRIKRGLSISGLVPERVAALIRTKDLYT
ncbi:MAG TPA: nicotinate (nicotinamide) nucleotide adenylyltransferase [Desulfobacteraceae bacterium]|nr:nicotinate (nicotinamide) nucleotide adenylyltransferase [Desulfobacteraceae bacterium]|tara:strand:+ start:900 stop:1544 length:645 start_codon:yes stop_codon:yes gene_type:complete